MNSFVRSITEITIGALAGTSAMTAFSYAVAHGADRQFREPKLLNQLLQRLLDHRVRNGVGWIIHYGVGFSFVTLYHQLWKDPDRKRVGNSFYLGLLTGLFGAGVWRAVLRLHPDPPRVPVKRFMLHLIIAHLIFVTVAKSTYVATRRLI